MTSRASRRAAMAAGLAGALFVAWLLVSSTGPAGPGDELEPGRAGPEVEEELSEQTETRLEALSEANASGIRWQVQGTVAGAPAPGWVGEQAIDPVADDWEPAIAADPSAPFVYLMTTHFVDKPCPGNCPVPHISLHVSSDGGKTWGSQRPLCACKGSWQFDPVVEVVRTPAPFMPPTSMASTSYSRARRTTARPGRLRSRPTAMSRGTTSPCSRRATMAETSTSRGTDRPAAIPGWLSRTTRGGVDTAEARRLQALLLRFRRRRSA